MEIANRYDLRPDFYKNINRYYLCPDIHGKIPACMISPDILGKITTGMIFVLISMEKCQPFPDIHGQIQLACSRVKI